MPSLNSQPSTLNSPAYRGRLAPSPTGHLHLGHARTFWLAAERARAAAGTVLLRNDDLDALRFRLDFVAAMLEDLRWLGFVWVEPVVTQSSRLPRYRAALLIGLRLTTLGQGELLFLAGPTFDIWNGAGETRTRFGGQLRLALEAPLGPLRLQNYLGYSLSGSLFNASEFPPEIARTAQQVLSLGVEVRLRL